jgi:hypothetical protein
VRTVSIIREFIALMMEAVSTTETSVYSNETTRRYIPEDFNIHTRSRENLKSHKAPPFKTILNEVQICLLGCTAV